MFKLILASAILVGFGGEVNRELQVISMTNVTSSGENTKPFVVARPGGGAYLAWARKDGQRTTVLFATSRDGERFDEPIQISTDGMDLDLGAESGPNVAVDGWGTIYVVWSAGSWTASSHQSAVGSSDTRKDTTRSDSAHAGHSGHGSHARKGAPARPGNLNIYLSRSNDGGRTFCRPVKVNDDPDGPEHRFPTVTTDDRGNLFVAWLDKRPRTDGSLACRVFVSTSPDQGRTFTPNADVTAGQDNAICHCCRVAIAAHSTSGIVVAFRNDVDDLRDVFVVRSSDIAQPFAAPTPIEETEWYIPMCPMNGPALVLDEAANLHASWVTGGKIDTRPFFPTRSSAGYRIFYRRFDSRRQQWDRPLNIADGEHVRLAILQGGRAILAWDGKGIVSVASIGTDSTTAHLLELSASGSFPSLAAESTGDELFAAWQERDSDERYQVKVARIQTQTRDND